MNMFGFVLWKVSTLMGGLLRRIRTVYYRNVLDKCGKNVRFDEKIQLITPSKIQLGSGVCINRGAILQGTSRGKIVVGKNVIFSYNAIILTKNQLIRDNTGLEESADVVIGNNVWICTGAIVLPGTIIEDNVVVAAGAVAKGKLLSNYVYGGIPAKIIKKRNEANCSLSK